MKKLVTNVKSFVIEHRIFIILAIISIILKVDFASLGPNPDLESWQIVGDVVSQGKTIYDNTARYNYGPFWAYICGGIALIVKSFGAPNVYTPTFHLLVASVLALADVIIAFLVMRLYSKPAGILFLLNPISLVLTGSHSQFDNMAVLFGLIGWYYYVNKKKGLSYLMFSISMIFKHLLIFFPLWLILFEFFNENTWKVKLKEISKIFSIYVAFLASFVFEIIRGIENKDLIISGIIKNVVMYRGYGASLGTVVVDLLVPKTLFDLSLNFPVFKGYMFFYMLFVVIAGLIFVKRKIDVKYAFPFYLAVFFALSFSVARQYFVIPLIAVYIFYDRIESIIYTITGFIFVVTNAFSNVIQHVKITNYLHLFGQDIKILPWSHEIVVSYNNAQVWVLVLCVSILLIGKFSLAPKFEKWLKYTYIGIFFLMYLSLGLYFTSRTVKADQNLPIILQNTEDSVKFTCTSIANSVYTVYEIKKNLTADKTLIDKFVTCEKPLPLF